MKDFNDIKVKLTPKSCNSIAYSLVRLVIEKCETVVWVKARTPEKFIQFNSLKE